MERFSSLQKAQRQKRKLTSRDYKKVLLKYKVNFSHIQLHVDSCLLIHVAFGAFLPHIGKANSLSHLLLFTRISLINVTH